ncbi:MAG TPA: hypothetical protein VHE37_01455 [Nevskiaceae bacterium]|nr:hypothetical protein [Nevskiaceae bacterium]
MKLTIRVTTFAVLLAAAIPAASWARGNVDDVPGVEDGPALSASAARSMDLGFTELHTDRGSIADGGAMSTSYRTPDGKLVELQMDPISGEITQSDKDAAVQRRQPAR